MGEKKEKQWKDWKILTTLAICMEKYPFIGMITSIALFKVPKGVRAMKFCLGLLSTSTKIR